MPTATQLDLDPALAEEIITRWLTGTPVDGWDNPAGQLFTSGEYAVQDITMTTGGCGTNCSSCTGSRPVACC